MIQKYRSWFLTGLSKPRKEFVSPEVLRDSLLELKDKVPGCWCVPKPCHGDVLKELAESRIKVSWTGITSIAINPFL